MTKAHPSYNQQLAPCKAAITFFVRADAKPKIRAALADAGFGCSYQEGLCEMLKDLLIQQGRDPKI